MSRSLPELLRFLVEEVLRGRGAELDAPLIARRVFSRTGAVDPSSDPIVRIQCGRLRRSLERYYLRSSDPDIMRIVLRSGHYAPAFVACPVSWPASWDPISEA
jgi:hypothetical protein